MLKFCGNTVVLFHKILQCVTGEMLHLMLHFTHALLHAEHILLDAEQLLVDRLITVDVLMLLKIAERLAFCECHDAGIRLKLADDHTQKCRLTGAVDTDDSGLFVVLDMEGCLCYDAFSSECLADILT